MRTMRKINKPIKFFGLSSGQFAIFMLLTALTVIVSIFKQLHPLIVANHLRNAVPVGATVQDTEKGA